MFFMCLNFGREMFVSFNKYVGDILLNSYKQTCHTNGYYEYLTIIQYYIYVLILIKVVLNTTYQIVVYLICDFRLWIYFYVNPIIIGNTKRSMTNIYMTIYRISIANTKHNAINPGLIAFWCYKLVNWDPKIFVEVTKANKACTITLSCLCLNFKLKRWSWNWFIHCTFCQTNKVIYLHIALQ